jgi:phosphoenolpyruvate synthase/pyruvate phosphate dikinase
MDRLKAYSQNSEIINQNFIFHTQPIKESRYAKLFISELPKKFKLNSEDAVLSTILRIGAYIKDDVSALLEDRGKKLDHLLKEIAERLSITQEDLSYLVLDEIGSALKNRSVNAKLLEKRRNLTIFFYPERTLEIYEGDTAENFLKEGTFKVVVPDTNVSELKGQIASAGKVSGRAVVVKNSDEAMKLVKEGDILVAPYTAPEYLPAMRRAVAIVTQTGGITSHASIVSRELKIPCIIGVSDVTTILHTGDVIEVDANEGLVRILKRS